MLHLRITQMARVFDCRNYIPNYCYQKVAGSIPAVEIFALFDKIRQKVRPDLENNPYGSVGVNPPLPP